LIDILQVTQQQAMVQITPARLFEKIPELRFEAEPSDCPVDHRPMGIVKTCRRTIKSIGIGTFRALHAVRGCKQHPEVGLFPSQALDELVAPNSNVAYNVIVEIGRLRFMENRQVNEIQTILLHKDLIALCTSEIERLIDKFIFYLFAVHQESTPLLKAQIKAQGGYILHLDGTCEGDSPKLVSSVDSVSEIVLYSAKLTSENATEIAEFLTSIAKHFGCPLAIVSDMSQPMKTAAELVFDNVPHYICHFHFVASIGKLLFEKEHDALRKALSKAGISGQLKALRLKLAGNFQTLSIDNLPDYVQSPPKAGKTREATELFAYGLILWILDHAAEGNGYGFPFDQRYLYFYQRLQAAQALLNCVKNYYSTQTDDDKIIWELYHQIKVISDDKKLKNTVGLYRKKLAVFTQLRTALAVAPEANSKGLRKSEENFSGENLQKIKTAVEGFMRELDVELETTTDKSLQTSFSKVKERLLKYWERLFADPFVIEVNGEEKLFFVQRTNNIMEHQFRGLTYSYRRIHGNRSVRRNLENIPAALPLVLNLKNPDYIKLVFGDAANIAKRFSEIDAAQIRTMAKEHYNSKNKKNSQKNKKMLRHPDFYNQLKAAFVMVTS